jgi:hypothetical protein
VFVPLGYWVENCKVELAIHKTISILISYNMSKLSWLTQHFTTFLRLEVPLYLKNESQLSHDSYTKGWLALKATDSECFKSYLCFVNLSTNNVFEKELYLLMWTWNFFWSKGSTWCIYKFLDPWSTLCILRSGASCAVKHTGLVWQNSHMIHICIPASIVHTTGNAFIKRNPWMH